MDGFKRPIRPQQQPRAHNGQQLPGPVAGAQAPEVRLAAAEAVTPDRDVNQTQLPTSGVAESTVADAPTSPRLRRRLRRVWIGIGSVVVLLFVASAAYLWFDRSLQAVDSKNVEMSRFEIKEGATFEEIATQLEQRKLIRSAVAFDLYARLQGKRGSLKVSTCSLRASMAASEILDKLSSGCHDFMSIMFYPGATIEKPLYKPADATIDQGKMNIKYVLKSAGFSDEAIAAALKKQYNTPLFADKPAGTTLEGYIFGETYYVDKSATAEDVLKETFSHMYKIVQQNDLVAKYRQHGLTLYQGITLASIVQRELNCEGKPTAERKARCYECQRSIAQVFLKRLKEGISLGSDVTFIYAADMIKVSPSVDLDSPYNTRRYSGLPPGPIASPGELALKSVANPSDTDYLYFIAGDDGLIYFAKDEAGHQKNIRDHCQKMCGNAV